MRCFEAHLLSCNLCTVSKMLFIYFSDLRLLNSRIYACSYFSPLLPFEYDLHILIKLLINSLSKNHSPILSSNSTGLSVTATMLAS